MKNINVSFVLELKMLTNKKIVYTYEICFYDKKGKFINGTFSKIDRNEVIAILNTFKTKILKENSSKHIVKIIELSNPIQYKK